MPENVFRQSYRELTTAEKDHANSIKMMAFELLKLFDSNMMPISAGREIACAKTHLEESVMWAIKGLTK